MSYIVVFYTTQPIQSKGYTEYMSGVIDNDIIYLAQF